MENQYERMTKFGRHDIIGSHKGPVPMLAHGVRKHRFPARERSCIGLHSRFDLVLAAHI